MRSTTAVEQILGRVMRLPAARRKVRDDLNMAYAFAASADFVDAARALQDALVQNGFNRQEVKELITSLPVNEQGRFDLFFETREVVCEAPKLELLPEVVRKKVSFDPEAKALIFTGEMDDREMKALQECFDSSEAKAGVETICRNSRRYLKKQAATPAERFEPFAVPVLAVRQGNLFEPFEETHFHEVPLRLSKCPPELSEEEYSAKRFDGKLAEIDISSRGQLSVRFVDTLHHQLSLLLDEGRQSVAQLVNWIDRNLPNRQDIFPSESGPYLTGVIHTLIDKRGFTLAQLIGDKYLLLQKVAEKIDALRKSQWSQSHQMFLLPECATPLVVTPTACFVYNPNEYPYNTRYQGAHIFRKHYYQEIGAMNGEEERCAVFLDRMAELEFWARNIERRPMHSFWLQTATDKFYPDFVCKLRDGRYLVVEYKSEKSWSDDDSKEKRALGELWAKRSGGACLFVMPKGLDFAAIETAVNA